jgi:hypothetical protein
MLDRSTWQSAAAGAAILHEYAHSLQPQLQVLRMAVQPQSKAAATHNTGAAAEDKGQHSLITADFAP